MQKTSIRTNEGQNTADGCRLLETCGTEKYCSFNPTLDPRGNIANRLLNILAIYMESTILTKEKYDTDTNSGGIYINCVVFKFYMINYWF